MTGSARRSGLILLVLLLAALAYGVLTSRVEPEPQPPAPAPPALPGTSIPPLVRDLRALASVLPAPASGTGDGAGVPATGTAEQQAVLEQGLAALMHRAMARIGPVLGEFTDVEAFLSGREQAEAERLALPEELRRTLLDQLYSEDPRRQIAAILALGEVVLTEEDLLFIEQRLDMEIAGMRDSVAKNNVLALAYTLHAQGRRSGLDVLADALRTGTGSDIPDFRNGAVLVLAAVRDAESAPLLRELLLSDPEPAVRKHAAVGLGAMGSEEDRDALAEALQREQDLEVRAWTALARGRSATAGEPDPALLRALVEDPAGEVRGAAAFGLATAGDDAMLIDAFYHDDHPFTRLGTVAAIARGGNGASEEFVAEEGGPFLMDTARNGEGSDLRFYAVRALGYLYPSTERSATFRAVAAEDSSRRVRGAAIDMLVRMDGVEAVPFLTQRLAEEKSGRVRQQIKAAMAGLEPD